MNLSTEVALIFFLTFKVSMNLNFWFDALLYIGLFLCFDDPDRKVDSGGRFWAFLVKEQQKQNKI